MIRAVNSTVAVHAILAQELPVCAGRGHACAAADGARMKRRQVALLAQHRRAGLQQVAVIGAVRAVTKRTVLENRCVLPEERTAFFSMAGIAGFVDGQAGQHAGSAATVRGVAVGAIHQAGAQWMRR